MVCGNPLDRAALPDVNVMRRDGLDLPARVDRHNGGAGGRRAVNQA